MVRRFPVEFGEFDRAKRPKRLPMVLTRDQVKCVLVRTEGTQTRMDRLLASCPRGRFAAGDVDMNLPSSHQHEWASQTVAERSQDTLHFAADRPIRQKRLTPLG